MRARLASFWEDVRDSYWIVPLAMTVAALIVAHFVLAFDRSHGVEWARSNPWIYSGGSEGARGVLGAIAGSVITVAGVVFSTTITSLTLSASQFGPRLLRLFVRDRGNQVVLGVFTATFAFCLYILRTIRSADELLFVPYLGVTIALFLGLSSGGVLVYFLHHTAHSIQIEHVVAKTASEWLRTIEKNLPKASEAETRENDMDWEDALCLEAPESGYLQGLDFGALAEWARGCGGTVKVEKQIGDFIGRGEKWAKVSSPDCARHSEGAWGCLAVGPHRNATQDIRYPLQQIVEIALIALSPGVNIQFTATTCIDWIGVGLREIGLRGAQKTQFCDSENQPRVWMEPVDFAAICAAAFDSIRQSGKANSTTVFRLLGTIEQLGKTLQNPAQKTILRQHAQAIAADAMAEADNLNDKREFEAALGRTLRALGE